MQQFFDFMFSLGSITQVIGSIILITLVVVSFIICKLTGEM